ncbi:MAG: dienelactone hydrolase family protein [Bacteroidales bacterium]|nr:dienelactone hydrolase family protein [Bacteroidales bacterium]
MQNKQRNSFLRSISLQVFITASVFVLTLVLSSFNVIKKNTITFASADGLEVTADQYIIDNDNPYILLFHEQESSRGEFETIARRLCKMNYSCLAVDLRNGGNKCFVSNETAKRCRESKCPAAVNDIELDMVAAIEYAFNKSNHPVILLGSGANGSLSLKVAKENNNVRAVVALSPGEYFLPDINVKDTITGLKKPVFITSSLSEFSYVSQLASGVEEQYITLFEPQLGEGGRGTVALSAENDNNSEYWLALLLFFKDLV